MCADWNFPTPDGKAHFRTVELPPTPSLSGSDGKRVTVRTGDGKFIVSTRRGKQFNSLVYAEVDPINGAGRDAVLMNPEDAASLRLMNGDRVALVSGIGRYEGQVFLAPIARGNLQIHWPEGNVIIRRGVVDKAGGVPDYNARVIVEKIL